MENDLKSKNHHAHHQNHQNHSKKMRKTIHCLTLLFLMACQQEPLPKNDFEPIDYTKLPEATQEGKNTFGCKVNGEVWVPRVPLLSWTLHDKAMSFDESKGLGHGHGSFSLVDSSINDWMSFSFGFTFFQSNQFCAAENASDSTLLTVIFNRNGGIGPYYDSKYEAYPPISCMNITKVDTVNNFVSGTFEFKLFNTENPKDSIVITDGRFDMKYYPE